jgi:hypothetical protein
MTSLDVALQGAVADLHFQLYRGIERLKADENTRQDRLHEVLCEPYAHHAAGGRALNVLKHVVVQIKEPTSVLQCQLALWREYSRPSVALKERDSEAFLQAFHLQADGWWRAAEMVGSLAKASVIAYRDERTKGIHVDVEWKHCLAMLIVSLNTMNYLFASLTGSLGEVVTFAMRRKARRFATKEEY